MREGNPINKKAPWKVFAFFENGDYWLTKEATCASHASWLTLKGDLLKAVTFPVKEEMIYIYIYITSTEYFEKLITAVITILDFTLRNRLFKDLISSNYYTNQF